MYKSLNRKNEGFTIIEVLIVLAIAGLILLVVFLAVPALQRNSRNTQRRNDVAGLLGGIAEFTANNNGELPTTAAEVTANANTGYYLGEGTGQGEISIRVSAGPGAALAETAADDRVVIVTGATCGVDGATEDGSARQVVAQFQVETSTGFQAQCQEG